MNEYELRRVLHDCIIYLEVVLTQLANERRLAAVDGDGRVFCSDGSIWKWVDGGWHEVRPIPGTKRDQELQEESKK